jgi:biopolymer transport protein ExbD
MIRFLSAMFCLGAIVPAAWSADANTPPAPSARSTNSGQASSGPSTRPGGKTVNVGLVRVDLAKRQMSFDAEVCLRQGALEFLVVGWQTKTHESILQTRARASHLHAGLLMLGLVPGKPARWAGPGEGMRFLPPAGAGLKMRFNWKDAEGKSRGADAADWLAGEEDREIERPEQWIFIGSDVLPDGRYWAELDGEMVSITNFASAVIDVPFRSSSVNDERGFSAKTDAIPPTGTKVEVVLTPVAGAEKAPDARQTVEIDRFGQRQVDGQALTEDQLEKWAGNYVTAHERGMVVIRADGMARVWDVAATQSVLRLGGVREFDIQRVPPPHDLLPRSTGQARAAIAQWKDKFINYRELLEDPGLGAERTLAQIDAELRQIEAQKELMKDYAAQLKRALATYKAATQPAGPAAEDGK